MNGTLGAFTGTFDLSPHQRLHAFNVLVERYQDVQHGLRVFFSLSAEQIADKSHGSQPGFGDDLQEFLINSSWEGLVVGENVGYTDRPSGSRR